MNSITRTKLIKAMKKHNMENNMETKRTEQHLLIAGVSLITLFLICLWLIL